MLLAASQIVAVEDEVTVSTVEVTVGRGIHSHLFAILNTPDLKARPQPVLPKHTTLIHLGLFKKLLARSYLDLALAIIHHAVLGCHGLVGVQGGGIEGHLLHFGYATDGEGLTGARRLVFVPPVAEELLKQSRLSSRRKYLDLQGQRGILACVY